MRPSISAKKRYPTPDYHADILPEIPNNPENRCYICKRYVFTKLKTAALQAGFNHLLDGTNADDSGVYRPGLAALSELGIRSPLLENGITKPEVRQFSRKWACQLLKNLPMPAYLPGSLIITR